MQPEHQSRTCLYNKHIYLLNNRKSPCKKRLFQSTYMIEKDVLFTVTNKTTCLPHEKNFSKWTRRESNPCPKAHPLSFYYRSKLLWGSAPLFPPGYGSSRPCPFGSFIIRPQPQSLSCVVSYKFDVSYLICRCIKADGSRQAAIAKLSSAFNFNLRFIAPSCG